MYNMTERKIFVIFMIKLYVIIIIIIAATMLLIITIYIVLSTNS